VAARSRGTRKVIFSDFLILLVKERFWCLKLYPDLFYTLYSTLYYQTVSSYNLTTQITTF